MLYTDNTKLEDLHSVLAEKDNLDQLVKIARCDASFQGVIENLRNDSRFAVLFTSRDTDGPLAASTSVHTENAEKLDGSSHDSGGMGDVLVRGREENDDDDNLYA